MICPFVHLFKQLGFFSRSLRSCSDAEAGTEKLVSEKFETEEGAISEAASGTAAAADEFEEFGELLSSSLLSSASYVERMSKVFAFWI